jgi:hypothetical protein
MHCKESRIPSYARGWAVLWQGNINRSSNHMQDFDVFARWSCIPAPKILISSVTFGTFGTSTCGHSYAYSEQSTAVAMIIAANILSAALSSCIVLRDCNKMIMISHHCRHRGGVIRGRRPNARQTRLQLTSRRANEFGENGGYDVAP